MLAPGTIIEVQLPGQEAPIQAAVLSCSSTLVSVRLQEVGSEAVHRVSLKKLPYTVMSQPADQQQRADDPQQQRQESVGSSSSEEEEEAAEGHQALDDDDSGGPSEEEEEAGSEGEELDALDAFPAETAAAVEAFAAAVEADPAAFLQPDAQLAALAKAAVKALYDYRASLEGGDGASLATAPGALPQLYVEGFDAEQIWLQLELAAGPGLKRARRLLKKAGPEPELLTAEMEEAIEDLLDEQQGGSEGGSGSESSEGSEGEADLDGLDYDALLAAGAAQRSKRAAGGTSDSEEDDEAAQQAARLKRKRAAGSAARAAVEDEHFKLDEMEEFLQQAEREAAGRDDEMEGADGDVGSEDEEARLETLLEKAAAETGRDKKRAKKARKGAGAPIKDGEAGGMEEDGEDNMGTWATYEDFFGPRSGGRTPTLVVAGGQRRGQRGKAEDEPPEIGEQDSEEEEEEEDEFKDDFLSDDMLSGEEDEGGAPHRTQHEPEPGSEEDWDSDQVAAPRDVLADSEDEADEEEAGEEEVAPSAHERRQERMQERIRKLEEAAMGEKDWFMQGEVEAGRRPKNSALEIDLDFETTIKPPPQPTEEMTKSLDELIKARIVEGRFDDVVRLAPAAPETKRTTLELDDKKSQQGLGELYEQEYIQAVTGAVDDKDEEVRQLARAQFSTLCAKLDALSHLHFTPRPIIEEVTVKVDVPAIMMEEAAPQFVSGASMRAPEEVFATTAAGAPRAEEELTKEDRKRRRAQKKRGSKKRQASKEEARAGRAAVEGRPTAPPLAGRKSEAAVQAARKLEKKGGKRAGDRHGGTAGKRSEFSRSAAVFAKIQQHADGTAAAAAPPASTQKARHLKL